MMEIEQSDIGTLRNRILESALSAATVVKQSTSSGIEFLRSIKFEQIGRHPLEDRPLNFIEQINQTFTCLVTLRAAELLFQWHPAIRRVRLNVGAIGGSDIESLDGTFAAELFAAVDPKNNRKLVKDIVKVAKREDMKHRYVFFHSPPFEEGRLSEFETVTGVQVWSVSI